MRLSLIQMQIGEWDEGLFSLVCWRFCSGWRYHTVAKILTKLWLAARPSVAIRSDGDIRTRHVSGRSWSSPIIIYTSVSHSYTHIHIHNYNHIHMDMECDKTKSTNRICHHWTAPETSDLIVGKHLALVRFWTCLHITYIFSLLNKTHDSGIGVNETFRSSSPR